MALEVKGGCAAGAVPRVAGLVGAGRLGRLVLVRYAVRVVAPPATARMAACLDAAARHAAAVLAALSGPPPTWAFGLRRAIAPATEPNYLAGHFHLADGAFATIEAHATPAGRGFKLWEELVVVGTGGMARAGSDWGRAVFVHDRGGGRVLCRVAAAPLAWTDGEGDWARLPGVSRSVVEGILAQLAEGGGKTDGR